MALTREAIAESDQLMEQLRRWLKHLGAPTLLASSLNPIAFLLPLSITGEQLWAQIADPRLVLLLSQSYQEQDALPRAYGEARATALRPLWRHPARCGTSRPSATQAPSERARSLRWASLRRGRAAR